MLIRLTPLASELFRDRPSGGWLSVRRELWRRPMDGSQRM